MRSLWVRTFLSELGKAQGLIPELRRPVQPLLGRIESLSERIANYNERIEQLAQQNICRWRYWKVKAVGMLIALAFLLTLEDSQRARKSRDLGYYLCLEPGRRNSGQSEPQTHTSKECDPYLRTLLVPGARHILSPFGLNSDRRRWYLSWPSVAASGTVSRRPSQLS
jgi:transposase